MSARWFLVYSLVIVVILSLPLSVAAQNRVTVRGTVLSLNMGNNSFLVREQSSGQTRFWIVKRTTKTRVEVGGKRANFSRLRVNDIVDVEGRRTAAREILATEIEVRGRATQAQRPQPPVVLRPPTNPINIPLPSLQDVLRITSPPEILQPENGARVSGAFNIVGRTAPRAQVRIEVTTRYLVFDLPAASAEVTADDRGIFSYSVQPLARLDNATYRISAKARLLGLESPEASVTVFQR